MRKRRRKYRQPKKKPVSRRKQWSLESLPLVQCLHVANVELLPDLSFIDNLVKTGGEEIEKTTNSFSSQGT